MKLLLTEDGSHTIYSEQFDEIYHSRHGAVAESTHVFIQSGLTAIDKKEINIFEVGFGTGLNAFLTWVYAEGKDLHVNYTSIELYPVSEPLLAEINYPSLFPKHDAKVSAIHQAMWNEKVDLSPNFNLHKIHGSVLDLSLPSATMDLIYFDAFSPEKQPELWSADVFKKMYDLLADGGILTTYCSKSFVRRNMQEVGFKVEKLQGPRGKREMVRAMKRS
jgi:tRNA U34 5-methylaminomethyl-2-thiouridine-forming methyltransferase MnmC